MAQSTGAPLMGFSNAAALNALGVASPPLMSGGDDPKAYNGPPVQALLAQLLGQTAGSGTTSPTTGPVTPQPGAGSLLNGGPNLSGTAPPAGTQLPTGGGGTGSLLNGGGTPGIFGNPTPSGGTPYQAPNTTWGYSGDRLMRYTPQNGNQDPGLLPNNPFQPLPSPQPNPGGLGNTPSPIHQNPGTGGGGPIVGSGNPDSGFGPIVPVPKDTRPPLTTPPWKVGGNPWETLPVTGKSAPQLAGFSDADLYRNVGNNQQLTTDLIARDGYEKYAQMVNKYNTGAQFTAENGQDYATSRDAQMAVQKKIADLYGLPDPNQGLMTKEQYLKSLQLSPEMLALGFTTKG